jgi:methylenetetrahydrofolate--tRNA-(uracil-5-)-methyltransferase
MENFVVVIGGGLAGCEAAYQIAKRGVRVKLYEMKPECFSPAHSNANLAEIVCSNSFKSNSITNACGLLKEELRMMDSLLIKCADKSKVPAGQALAVDRENFAKLVTEEIESNSNIDVVRKEYTEINDNVVTIIATGPLTSERLSERIAKLTGEDNFYFYDAAAPIVTKESINMNIAFYGDRYGKESDSSYINLPFTKEEYLNFYNELVNAEVAMIHNFEKKEIFEGCMPIEVMAKRGEDTIRFGPLKPVGFIDPRTNTKPYAIVQLRQDNEIGSLYNLVGFQTNLKFGEQKRVFSMIPGLEHADFVKYGVMHRNTYINSPKLLDNSYNLKINGNIYFAGQISGVEGYVESIASGLIAGINAANKINGKPKMSFPKETVLGSLSNYISTDNEKFQPMNANFGILPQLDTKIKDKQVKYREMANRSLNKISKIIT